VRVIAKFLGLWFSGGKPFIRGRTFSLRPAASARQLGKPVKLVVSRKMMFPDRRASAHARSNVLRLGATREGKLVFVSKHDYIYHMSMIRPLPRGKLR